MFAVVGGDAGVGFDSQYYVQDRLTINILSNITNGNEEMKEVALRHLRLPRHRSDGSEVAV
jgi:hypothetical protein